MSSCWLYCNTQKAERDKPNQSHKLSGKGFKQCFASHASHNILVGLRYEAGAAQRRGKKEKGQRREPEERSKRNLVRAKLWRELAGDCVWESGFPTRTAFVKEALVKNGACHSQKLKTTNLTKMLVQTLSVLDPCGCASALRRGNFEKMTFKRNDLKR